MYLLGEGSTPRVINGRILFESFARLDVDERGACRLVSLREVFPPRVLAEEDDMRLRAS